MKTCLKMITALALLSLASQASEPNLEWAYTARTNLYAPPLCADMHPSPGLETVLSDSEARRLLCISSKGEKIWECDGGWKLRLTTAAALSMTARTDGRTLLIGSSDGKLTCLDAQDGKPLWSREIGKIEWGGVLWADLNGDGRDEAVAGTESNGIHVFRGDGSLLWVYPAAPEKEKPYLFSTLAAADVNSDGKAELFGVGRLGPFSLGPEGALLWEKQTGDDYKSSAIIGDADGDGQAEVYSASIDDNILWSRNAANGELLWRTHMVGPIESISGGTLCMGDLNGDDKQEILISDTQGLLHCFDASGSLLWLFQADKPDDLAPSLGDVDGDEAIEVLAACGDHNLYCLSGDGELEWKVSADLRLLNPATIADIDLDGKTEILACGSDRKLRCYELNGRHHEELIPWPSRRFDVQQSGSSFNQSGSQKAARIAQTREHLQNGGFANVKTSTWRPENPILKELADQRKRLPRNWNLEKGNPDAWRLDTEHQSGKLALKVEPSTKTMLISSEDSVLGNNLLSIDAGIQAKGGDGIKARLRWKGKSGILREDALQAVEAEDSTGWGWLGVKDVVPPPRAKWVSLVVEATPPNSQPVWLDGASITGKYSPLATVQPLVNQVGYDVGSPKSFVVQSNFDSVEGSFEIIDDNGNTVHSASLTHRGEIIGAFQSNWGKYYWRGEFTAFDRKGHYRIRALLKSPDGMQTVEGVSYPFRVEKDLLWEATSRPAYRFFYYQRCGMAIPGIHEACHMDDAASSDGARQFSLVGGWHDAGDYNKYHNAPYELGLATAYSLLPEDYAKQDEDRNGLSDFLDEIIWGAEHVSRMITEEGSVHAAITSGYGFWNAPDLETDNLPGTGDERRTQGPDAGGDSSEHVAALAKAARLTKDASMVAVADRGLQWTLKKGIKGAHQLSAALDLFAATGRKDYEALAREFEPSLPSMDVEIIRNYDRTLNADHSQIIRERLVKEADGILRMANNPFGICAFGTPESPNFFNTSPDTDGWHVGTSSHLFTMANKVAQAYYYEPKPEYLAFVYDQFNWTLGANPYDLCLMEGQGSLNPPTYHNRLTMAGVKRGAVPGSIVNGITWEGIGIDRPYFDMSGSDIPDFEPNEVWLPHNTNYLNALTNLQLSRKPH